MRTLATLGVVASIYAAVIQPLPTVVILSTGGTIASRYDPDKGGLVPALSGSELVEAVPELADVAQVRVEQISNIGSADMTPEIWLKLARRANEVLSRDDVTGVVVTHGTDTLEETAYFLDLTVTARSQPQEDFVATRRQPGLRPRLALAPAARSRRVQTLPLLIR